MMRRTFLTSALDMPEIMSYIYSKSWKLQFSASSSIIIIEDYYLQTFLHSLAEAYFDRNNSDGWSKGVARCPLNFVLIFLYSINNLFFLTIHRFLLLPLQSPPLFTYVINTVRFIYHVNFIELISFVYRIIFLNNLFN